MAKKMCSKLTKGDKCVFFYCFYCQFEYLNERVAAGDAVRNSLYARFSWLMIF